MSEDRAAASEEPKGGPSGRTPLVSVITPTYNGSKYISKTIDSALAQTYPNLEIVVVDDDSSDETPQILEGYGDQIRVLKLSRGGENVARNAAVEASRGEYIALLDHDDLWLPEKISLQVAKLEANPQAGLCHCGYQRLHDDGLGQTLMHKDPERYAGNCFQTVFKKNGIGALTAVVRRSALPPHVFHEDIQISADYALWLDVLFEHGAEYVQQVLAYHRQHSRQITHGRRERWKMYEAVARMRVLRRYREQMSEAEHESLSRWTLDTLREASHERRRNGDHGWASLGFDLLRRYGEDVPWLERTHSALAGWAQSLTAEGKAEKRYLNRPA